MAELYRVLFPTTRRSLVIPGCSTLEKPREILLVDVGNNLVRVKTRLLLNRIMEHAGCTPGTPTC